MSVVSWLVKLAWGGLKVNWGAWLKTACWPGGSNLVVAFSVLVGMLLVFSLLLSGSTWLDFSVGWVRLIVGALK